MGNGLVSIIIPVYNREKYLEECVSSVFAQTYQKFEIILIDDGSTDNTLKICEEFARKDERVKLFTEKHGGVSNARNIGLDAAQGEFVFFLDSDDVIHPVLLEALVSGLYDTDAGMAGTSVAHPGKDKWYRVAEVCKEERSKEYTYHNFQESIDAVVHGGTSFSYIGGVMMRRTLIGNTRFEPSFFIGEDFLFNYENLIKGCSTVFLDKKLYYARTHENNSSWNWKFSGFHNRFKRREWVWEKEESFGRIDNANVQKRSVLGCFIICIQENRLYGEENKKIRSYMKSKKKILFPAFNKVNKIAFYLGCYFPALFICCIKVYGIAKNIMRKNKK